MTRVHARILLGVVALLAGTVMSAQKQGGTTTRREPQFENEHVRVWKSVIMPRQPLALHRHDHGRTLIALTDGELKVFDEQGTHVHTYRWERGKAYWLEADPPGRLHADRNDTSRPIEVIVVELKRDR
jgi:quercetin dioxygenase-like cupin family protein